MNRAKTHGTDEQFYMAINDLNKAGYYPVWISNDGLTIIELLYQEHDEYVWLEKHLTRGKSLNSAGYQMVYLRCEEGVTLVHRLVAAAWLGMNSGMEVDHINGDKTDNRAENLRYVTHSENMKAAYRNSLISNPTFKGRYNLRTSTFIAKNHTRIKMKPEEYVAYRINRKLPVRGWMKEYEEKALELL